MSSFFISLPAWPLYLIVLLCLFAALGLDALARATTWEQDP